MNKTTEFKFQIAKGLNNGIVVLTFPNMDGISEEHKEDYKDWFRYEVADDLEDMCDDFEVGVYAIHIKYLVYSEDDFEVELIDSTKLAVKGAVANA